MKDAKGNHGLFVRGAGTCVTATNCKFTGNGMSGVAVLAQVRLPLFFQIFLFSLPESSTSLHCVFDPITGGHIESNHSKA